MIRAEPLHRQTVARVPAGRTSAVTPKTLADVWALLADDRRAIRLKMYLLGLAAVITALLEAPWR